MKNNGCLVKPEKIVIVLGMHRSGTSCLTGSLQQAGLVLGEFSEWNPHNLKGNRENSEIMLLNDSVLKANGGTWDKPPRKVNWSPEFRKQALMILEKYAHHTVWGFKDPRTLLTLSGLTELGIAPDFIGIFRHPSSVAASLIQRSAGRFTQAWGYQLWYEYNLRLYALHIKSEFPLLCFDWEEDEFYDALNRALPKLGLNPSTNAERFYDSDLVHQNPDTSELPWKIGRLYSKLRKISEKYR